MFELNEEQRKTLLRIARQSIAAVLEGSSPDWKGDDFDETLRQPAGAFVTLTRDGDLRGCIELVRRFGRLALLPPGPAFIAGDHEDDPLDTAELVATINRMRTGAG